MWPLQKFRCKAVMEGDIVSSNNVLRKGPILLGLEITCDDAENHTSESHGPRTLLMAPAQQQEETILAEDTGVVPAKCSPKIKSELFSLL